MQQMRVDVASGRAAFLLAAIAAVWMLVAFILGLAGPDMLYNRRMYAYGCPDNSHVWNATVCTGITMRDGLVWAHTFGTFGLLNKLWLLDVTPYKWNTYSDQTWENKDLEFSVSILGSDDSTLEFSRWKPIVTNDTHRMDFTCEERTSIECDRFTLLDIQYIDYAYYRVEIRLAPSSDREYVGDMQFSLHSYNASFSEMELGLRVGYLMLALFAIAAFLVAMKGIKFDDWAFEQKSALFLALGLLLYNDIFFPFEFWVRGWFFEFVNSIFEVIFISGVMLFWLFIIDKIRKDEPGVSWNLWQLGKIILVSLYAILAAIFFTWIRIRASKDPIYGDRDNLLGPIILFYFVAAIYACLLVWIIVLLILTVAAVLKRRDLVRRFILAGIPTTICIASILIGIFTGTIGPFNRDSLSWVYESAMYNVFVWILLLGYLPAQSAQDEETAPIREQELGPVHRPARESSRAAGIAGFDQHDDL